MLRWVRFRGAACEKLLFVFQDIPPGRQTELVSQIARIFRQNIQESSILQNLQVEISVEDDDGHELMKVGIVPGS